MAVLKLIEDIVANYQRHGWRLERVLLRSATRASISERESVFDNARVRDSEIDALWFFRASQKGREAWELRLIAEQQYALFEAFEADETEEQREEVRQEMEARMREHVTAG